MPRPDQQPPPNGAANGSQQPERPPTPEDVITEAESIRCALQECHTRLGRLIAALKQQRRYARAVEAAVASLRQLHP